MKILFLLFLFIIFCNSIEMSYCKKWFTKFGCDSTLVVIKNIFRSDSSSYLSTQLLSHKPEKKITFLIDFGIPNYIKTKLLNEINSAFDFNNFNHTINDLIIKSRLKYFSRYIDNFIFHHEPIFMNEDIFNLHTLNNGVKDTLIDHGKIIQLSSKGKSFKFHLKTIGDKSKISSLWSNSKYSSKYDGLLSLGRYSNIWTKYNYFYLDKTQLLFSEENIINVKTINENKIKIKCESLESIINYKILNNEKNISNILFDSKCYLLNSVKLEESHLSIKDSSNVYNLIFDFNSKLNYLPSKLYFILYDKTAETSSIYPKRITKGTSENKDNYLKIKINNNDNIIFKPDGVFDFTFNPTNEKDIILGADLFKYFSIIKKDNKLNTYEFWIEDIVSNNNYILMFINFIIIIETILFLRWYLTSNCAISNFGLFYILIQDNVFYFNNSQSFFEIFACFLSLITIFLSIYTFIYSSNLPIYLIISFSFLTFIILISIAFSILFIINTKENILKIFREPNQKLENQKRIQPYKIFTDLILPLSSYNIPKFKFSKPDKQEDEINNRNEKFKSTKSKIDNEILKIYSLSTHEIVNQPLLICIARNLNHMILIGLTIFLALLISIENKLTKAILTMISTLFIYHLIYYILILLYTVVQFYRIEKNKILWLIYLILMIIFIFIIIPFIIVTFIFNFLDSMNSNHSTLTVALTSIILVILNLLIGPKVILNDIERWKNIISNKIEFTVNKFIY